VDGQDKAAKRRPSTRSTKEGSSEERGRLELDVRLGVLGANGEEVTDEQKPADWRESIIRLVSERERNSLNVEISSFIR